MPDDTVTREIFGNIDGASKWIFYALVCGSMGSFAFGVYRRVRLWHIGSYEDRLIDWRAGCLRIWNYIVLQKTVRRSRQGAGTAHLLLFGGFCVLFVGTLLIAIEHYAASALGRDPTNPLFHKGIYFAIYEFVLDTAGLALLIGCTWFIRRRWQGASTIGHRWLDGLVLGVLVMLGITGYLAEGLRIIREQTPQPGFSYVGFSVARVFELCGVTRGGADTIHFILWWTHAVLALGFIAAFPYTRLLHSIAGAVILASRNTQLGIMTPVSIEDVEETGLVGAARIQDFTRWQLVELDACVSCGRCQDVCPAHESGKPLSPRDVVQDLRSYLNAAGPIGQPSHPDGSSARDETATLAELISAETIWSCTTCHACVDTCPLGVDPLRFITDLRRNFVGEGNLRGAPASSLQKMQRSGNPWGLPANERLNWAEGLNVPRASDNPDFEVLYWVGCAAAYDRRLQKVARAVVKLLQAADGNFAVLGPEERCTGESARRMGDEFLFQELAAKNLATLDRYSVRKIITHCPHCLNSFKHDYPQFGGTFDVVHHSQYLTELVAAGRLNIDETVTNSPGKLTYHDPCYLARVNNVTEPPRELIQLTLPSTDTNLELPRRKRDTACCGAGGGRMWFDDAPDSRVGASRVKEIIESGAEKVVVACPFCLTMIQDGLAAHGGALETRDIAELLVEALNTSD